MDKRRFCKPGKTAFADPGDYYILTAAVIAFLYMSFQSYTQALYEHGLVIPCMLFLGARKDGLRTQEGKKRFLLSGTMAAWFIFLQMKRSIEYAGLDNVGLFLTVYLFAFPLASVLQDGDRKKALKIFAWAYLSAAAVLAVCGLMLVSGCLPGFLAEHVFFDGGELVTFWHPNVAACYLMIGIVLCTTFMMHEKSCPLRIALFVLLVIMTGMLALTNSRTTIILTGVYLGSVIFFGLVRRGRKWIIPGIAGALVLAVLFCGAAVCLYQANYDRLIRTYTLQYSDRMDVDLSEIPETEPEEEYIEEDGEETETDGQGEWIPIGTDPDTGEIYLTAKGQDQSPEKDFGIWTTRSYVWSAARFAVRETPSILYWGMFEPGAYVSYYNFFPVAHLHNAWAECFVGMGIAGFVIAMLFTLGAIWNCLVVLVKHHQDIWKRNVALLTLAMLAAAVLEPYLFYTTVDFHPVNLLFFLCAGYLAHWQEPDNSSILKRIRERIALLKK